MLNNINKLILCMLILLLMSSLIQPTFAESTIVGTPLHPQTHYDTGCLMYAAMSQNYSGYGNCAEYVSYCLRASGINITVDGCTSLNKELSRYSNIDVYHMEVEPEPTSTSFTFVLDKEIADKMEFGDIVIYFCRNCERLGDWSYLHTLIYAGVNSKGCMIGYSHNPVESPGKSYWYWSRCYDCNALIRDVYFYHFNPLKSGWVEQNGEIFFVDENIQKVKGIVIINGKEYRFDNEGHPVSGVVYEGGRIKKYNKFGKLIKDIAVDFNTMNYVKD